MNVAPTRRYSRLKHPAPTSGFTTDIALFCACRSFSPTIASSRSQWQRQPANVVLAGGPNDAGRSSHFRSTRRSAAASSTRGRRDFGFMNQYRDPTQPTWVGGFEARFSVGEPMHACQRALPASPVLGPACRQLRLPFRCQPQRHRRTQTSCRYRPGHFSNFRTPGITRGTRLEFTR